MFCLQTPLTRALSYRAMKVPLSLTTVFILLSSCYIVYGDDEKYFVFDVKPGGAKNHFETEKWHGITCKFTYICQGGTDERWKTTLRRDDDFNYKCVVERPDSKSYLFFNEFQIDVTGANVEDVELLGEDLDKPVAPNQYIIDKEKNIVKNSKDSKPILNRIDVFLKRQKGTHDDL